MSVFIRAFLDCMRPFKVSLPFGWPGESGADPRSFTIARSYPGYGRAPPETKDGHPSSQAYSPAIRLNAEIRRHQHTIPDKASPLRDLITRTFPLTPSSWPPLRHGCPAQFMLERAHGIDSTPVWTFGDDLDTERQC